MSSQIIQYEPFIPRSSLLPSKRVCRRIIGGALLTIVVWLSVIAARLIHAYNRVVKETETANAAIISESPPLSPGAVRWNYTISNVLQNPLSTETLIYYENGYAINGNFQSGRRFRC